MADGVCVSIQCYMGRLDAVVKLDLTVQEAKRFFKRSFEALDQVNMDAYVINHRGELLLDETVTLKDAHVEAESVLILVKKTNCPAAGKKDEEDV